MNRRTTTSSLSSLFQLWIYFGCLSSSLAQLTREQLMTTCDSIEQRQAVDGAGSAIMIDCDHGPGGLVSLDWDLIRIGIANTTIVLDGDKYEDTSPSVQINRVTASDEGLYVCRFVLSGSMEETLNAGCLFVLAKARYRNCPDQPSSTQCQETIRSVPGMITFDTRVNYTGGGSLGLPQEIRRLQLYRGTNRFADNLLYTCNMDSQECTSSGMAVVVQGDTGQKYDISVQLQLTESDSDTYTVFADVFDPVSGSEMAISKSFIVQILPNMPTSTPTSPSTSPPTSTPTPNNSPSTDGLSQPGDNTTVIAVVVPLSIILVALLVIAVIAVTHIVVKHNSSRRDTVYELKIRPNSIIEEVPELQGYAESSNAKNV